MASCGAVDLLLRLSTLHGRSIIGPPLALLALVLSLSIPSARAGAQIPPCVDKGTLACDTTASDLLGLGEMHCYEFAGVGDEWVDIAISLGTPLEETWELYDPDEILIGSCTGGACNVKLPASKTGTYTIVTFDGGLDESDTYGLTWQGLSDGLTCGLPTTCDVTVTDVGIDEEGDTDTFTFNGIGDEVIDIAMSKEATNLEHLWQLYDPDGAFLGFCTGGACNSTLPSKTGTYTILVFDIGLDDTGSYDLTWQGLSDGLSCGQAIACDQTELSITVDAEGDTDTYTFSGIADEVVDIAISLGSALEEQWQLYDPDGLGVTSTGGGTCTGGACNATLPSKTGTYTILVFDGGLDETGSYDLTWQGLSEGLSCGQAIACDQTQLSITVDAEGDTDTYTFSGIADEVVDIAISLGSALEEWWQLYDPDGLRVTSTGGGTCTGGACNATLPSKTGTYTILVFDGGLDETGSYDLTWQGLSEGLTCGTALDCNESEEGAMIVASGDTDTYTFNGIADEVVEVAVSLNSTLEEQWQIYDPDGQGVASTPSPDGHTCTTGYCRTPLPSKTGTYTILVFDGGLDDAGSYNLSWHLVSEGTTCGEPGVCGVGIAGEISPIGDVDLYSFVAAPDDVFTISVEEASCTPFDERWTLYEPDGTPVWTCDNGSSPAICTVALPAGAEAGAYVLTVFDSGLDDEGLYSLTITGDSPGFTCDPAPVCIAGVDADSDGICDNLDNCLGVINPRQIDSNQDGYGNLCDTDYTNDIAVGIPDFNAILAGFGKDVCDVDLDPDFDSNGDGVIGIPDFNAFLTTFGGLPGPSGLSCQGMTPCP